MRVLVVNAGSSSLKLRLLDGDDDVVATKDVALDGGMGDEGAVDEEAVGKEVAALGRADAVGHRVVHGGARHASVRLDEDVMAELEGLADLAPLHQPAALAGIRAVTAVLPDVPQVACFDTAFHADLPAAAATFALPAEWRERWGLRRYGFHGLSHAWAARRASVMLGGDPGGHRVVTCHLGAGASLAAVHGGRSVDTTMGFTPLDGLVMATRSGAVDPGLVLWLQSIGGLGVDEVSEALEHRSGLLGLCGTGAMQEVVTRAVAGDERAVLALGVYVHRVRAGVAAMVAALGGLDALVFTGGVGEHAPTVRAQVVGGLGFLGLALDPVANVRAEPDAANDADLSAPGASAATLLVAAREDLQIAGEVRRVLGVGATGPGRRAGPG